MNALKSTLVVVILTVFALSGSTTSSFALHQATSGPYGEKAGNLYVTPEPFFAGQSVSITANFPSGHYWVVLLKETSPGSGQFEEIGFDESNTSGNAYFSDLDIDASTRMYAQTETRDDVGWHTGIRTVAPKPVDPSGPAAGSLYVDPDTFYAGQEIKVTANFPSGRFMVTLFQETAVGSGSYEAVGTDESNSSGNAIFSRYAVVDGPRKVFAVTEAGRYSQVRTLVPDVVDPTGKPTSGSLYISPESYFHGQEVKVTANFASGRFLVTLFQETEAGSGTYEVVGTDESNSSGNAYFSGHEVDGAKKLFALTEKGQYSPMRTLDPQPVVMPDVSTGVINFLPNEVPSGKPVTVVAGFLSRCRNTTVNFFRRAPVVGYTFIGSAVSDSSGDARLRNVVFHDTYGTSITLVAVTARGCPSGPPERTDFESVF